MLYKQPVKDIRTCTKNSQTNEDSQFLTNNSAGVESPIHPDLLSRKAGIQIPNRNKDVL